MPVKVRCSGCQKILSAPDAARGKAIKCPKCETKIRVPAASAGRTKAKAEPAVRQAGPDSDTIGSLDLSRFQDAGRLCQKCGAEVAVDDIDCPECGINLATGVLSKAAQKKRARRGPDRAEFYGKAWTDSWKFIKKNKSLVVRTGLYWTLFSIGSICCLIFQAMCENTPPAVFWGALYVLLQLGIPGWYWFLTGEIVKATMDKKDRLKRVEFDAFTNMALGLKASIWPYVLILPLFFLPPVWFLPLVAFPIAMVHMTRPYTYKAWLPWEMAKVFFKTAGPCLYWVMMSIVLTLPITVFALLAGLVFAVPVMNGLIRALEATTNWVLGLIGSAGQQPFEIAKLAAGEASLGFMGTMVLAGVGLTFLILFITPIMFAAALPGVFMMRVTGLFGYYFKNDLELVSETKAGVPAGFGPRYLAYLVDLFLVTVMIGAAFGIALGAGLLAIFLGITYLAVALWNITLFIIMPLIYFFYFAKAESGTGQSTLGKRAVGLIVTDMEGKPISLKVGAARLSAKKLSALAFIGFLMCIFHEKKQTLHDVITKTQVLWKGDEYTA